MSTQTSIDIRTLKRGDVQRFRDLLRLFGDVFDMPDAYHHNQPDDFYLEGLLASPDFIAVTAEIMGTGDVSSQTVGGLCAYVMRKFEQRRSEIYIYDLAVHSQFRRQKVATRLINRIQDIAAETGVYVIFVQADGDDEPAKALYCSLGVEEHVCHYDIPPTGHEPLGKR